MFAASGLAFRLHKKPPFRRDLVYLMAGLFSFPASDTKGGSVEYTRLMEIDCSRADSKNGTVPVVLSTEYPVQRGDYMEVLDHNASSIDLSRAPLPVVEGHKTAPVNIGLVDNLHIVNRKLRGELRLGNSERAKEIMHDIKNGIIRNVSIGYQIFKHTIKGQTLRATSWAPHELSLVGVPADPDSGLFRSKEMETTEKTRSERRKDNRAGAEERERVTSLLAIAERIKKTVKHIDVERKAREAIADGLSVESFQRDVFEWVQEHGRRQQNTTPMNYMESNGRRDYSVVRAIQALVDPKASNDAGFEIEVSQQLAHQRGRKTDGILMPLGVETRAVQKSGTGSSTIATEHMAPQFIDVLRAKSILLGLPVTRLDGLQGDISIPRQTGSATASWIAGDGADSLAPSDPTFDNVTLSPTTVGGLTIFSRKMLLQSNPGIEQIVMGDLAALIATEMDIQAINGDGLANRPTGILNTAGIGSVAMGANGLALASIDPLIDLEAAVANVNADSGSQAYVTNSKVIAALKKLKTTTGEYLWTNGQVGDYPSGTLGSINGLPVSSSNSVPSNLTKGTGTNLSAMVFGDWASLIVGTWGALELLADPYGTNFAAGSVSVRAMMDIDFAVRHPESFAAISDIVA